MHTVFKIIASPQSEISASLCPEISKMRLDLSVSHYCPSVHWAMMTHSTVAIRSTPPLLCHQVAHCSKGNLWGLLSAVQKVIQICWKKKKKAAGQMQTAFEYRWIQFGSHYADGVTSCNGLICFKVPTHLGATKCFLLTVKWSPLLFFACNCYTCWLQWHCTQEAQDSHTAPGSLYVVKSLQAAGSHIPHAPLLPIMPVS